LADSCDVSGGRRGGNIHAGAVQQYNTQNFYTNKQNASGEEDVVSREREREVKIIQKYISNFWRNCEKRERAIEVSCSSLSRRFAIADCISLGLVATEDQQMTAHADRPWSTSAAGHARQRTDSSRCWGFGSLLRRIATIAAAVATLHHGRGLCATPVISHQHVYEEDVGAVPYAVTGDGIHFAQTGVVATFYIDVLDDTATQELVSSRGTRFLYVWIANEEQVLVAQVRHVGGNIFSAEYKSNFPGIYRVHIENVDTSQRRETVVEPVVGSPFNLEISGEVTLDISNLPSCTEDDYYNLKKLPGTWISSALAPKPENVLRSGWVFQPEECNWDVLSPAELRALTGEWGRQLKGSGNDMWMLISGSSVQRGVYLALVDLILSTTMKDGMTDSPLAKCWGYAEVSIGSLRVSYQDFR
jgi:hypothetical protein